MITCEWQHEGISLPSWVERRRWFRIATCCEWCTHRSWFPATITTILPPNINEYLSLFVKNNEASRINIIRVQQLHYYSRTFGGWHTSCASLRPFSLSPLERNRTLVSISQVKFRFLHQIHNLVFFTPIGPLHTPPHSSTVSNDSQVSTIASHAHDVLCFPMCPHYTLTFFMYSSTNWGTSVRLL